ncbi:MAG: elongation factor G [Armatimonadetes bacterium]|nr:elongation factor G [Armatimonadota bacterium]
MKHTAEAIRNVALVGQRGSGKTSLAEMLLYTAKAIDRLGRVDDGTSTCDFDADEIQRKMTISTAIAPLEWGDSKINLLDTPGYSDFVGDVAGAVAVSEAALIVLDAVGGVEVGTEVGWDLAEKCMTRAFFINKMDRENADYLSTLDSLRNRFGNHVVALTMPIGSEDALEGIVDLVHMKAYTWSSGKMTEASIPAELQSQADELREALVEAAAEANDAFIEKYFNDGTLSDEEIVEGAHAGIKSGIISPVFCGSSARGIGAEPLLNLIAEEFPSPAEAPGREGRKAGSDSAEKRDVSSPEFSALVFKSTADPYVGKLTYFKVVSGTARSDSHMWNSTREHDERVGQLYFLKGKQQQPTPEIAPGDIGAVAKLQNTVTGDTLCDRNSAVVFSPIEFPEPVYSVAITAKSKADEDKLGPALGKLAEEDPTFRYHRDPETGETLISGLGDTHVDIIIDRLKRKFGVQVDSAIPSIPYRETILASAKAQGRHKKQTGGRGQFGDCWVEFEPVERGAGFQFVDAVVGGAIPRQYIPAVEKGIRESMERGLLAGYPVVDVRARVYDGSFHPVDSSEMAFKMAGAAALHNAAEKASPVILEPIVTAEIRVPDEYMGDVIGDLNGKRGRILGMEPDGSGKQLVKAQVPLAEMQRYAIDLKSIAHGRGTFRIQPSHYEEVPPVQTKEIIEHKKREHHVEE